jgi:8-oxo-dGTP pyrophosphatase MutT (NUDIX family)
MWAFVGGKIELGEESLAAAKRELLEETGLCSERDVIMDPIPVTSTDSISRDPDTGSITHHYVISHFCAEIIEHAVPRPGDDCLAIKWHTLEGLGDDPSVVPKCVHVAKAVKQRIRARFLDF